MASNPFSIQSVLTNVTGVTGSQTQAPAKTAEVPPPKVVVHQEILNTSGYSAASAEPKVALRGGTYANSLDPVEFANLSDVAKGEKVVALKARQSQLGEEIVDRLGKLRSRWNVLSPETQVKALRKFHDKSKRIDPIAKNELSRRLQRAEDAERKVSLLQRESDELEKPHKVKDPSRSREQVQSELSEARSEQSQMVQEATALVEEKNVMSDMLATSEDIIDSSASGQPGTSLLEKIAEFLNIDWFFLAIGVLKNPIQVAFKQEVEQRGRHIADINEMKLDAVRFREKVRLEMQGALRKDGMVAERQQGSHVKQAESQDDKATALAREAINH